MQKDTLEVPSSRAESHRPRPRFQDLEDDADRFEDALAAEMLRTGAIEVWT
jgi:hypothetical protein